MQNSIQTISLWLRKCCLTFEISPWCIVERCVPREDLGLEGLCPRLLNIFPWSHWQVWDLQEIQNQFDSRYLEFSCDRKGQLPFGRDFILGLSWILLNMSGCETAWDSKELSEISLQSASLVPCGSRLSVTPLFWSPLSSMLTSDRNLRNLRPLFTC